MATGDAINNNTEREHIWRCEEKMGYGPIYQDPFPPFLDAFQDRVIGIIKKGEVHPYLKVTFISGLYHEPDADSTDQRDFHIRSKKALLLASRFPYGEGQLRIKSLQEMVLRLKQEDRTFPRLFFEYLSVVSAKGKVFFFSFFQRLLQK